MRRAAALVCVLIGAALPARATDGAAVLRTALDAACKGSLTEINAVAARFPGGRILEAKVTDFRGKPGRAQFVLLVSEQSELRISRLFPLGRLRRISLEFHAVSETGARRPVMAVAANVNCKVIEGRRLIYGPDGSVVRLEVLDADLITIVAREPMNPTIPAGKDPGGVLVAVVDTGINYLLDNFANRLARDGMGKALGHDFWDRDDRPFDVDTGRSPFFPLHHGTAVASILLREAPKARVIPYRFPRPDMDRMGDLVAHADKAGARIVNLAMGSSKRDDWRTFEAAARARPHMLFIISAGNDGRDIDKRPVYPAALDLANILTVTSADGFGRLAQGSNWGRQSVDIMVPGENVAVIDHRGVAGRASGSSFAVPRVTALAARLLAINPAWTSANLIKAMRSRALPSSRQPNLPLSFGWIPDPTDDYLP